MCVRGVIWKKCSPLTQGLPATSALTEKKGKQKHFQAALTSTHCTWPTTKRLCGTKGVTCNFFGGDQVEQRGSRERKARPPWKGLYPPAFGKTPKKPPSLQPRPGTGKAPTRLLVLTLVSAPLSGILALNTAPAKQASETPHPVRAEGRTLGPGSSPPSVVLGHMGALSLCSTLEISSSE